MTKRTYICNVCRYEFQDTDGVIGFEFIGGGSASGHTATAWRTRNSRDCENHICTRCLNNAAELHKFLAPAKCF